MDVTSIASACLQAMRLLFSGDPALWLIIWTSFSVSLRAIAIATQLALLFAFVLACGRIPGRATLVYALNALLSFPP